MKQTSAQSDSSPRAGPADKELIMKGHERQKELVNWKHVEDINVFHG